MIKIAIIICGRYQTCGGGKCFRAMKERVGGFANYSKNEDLEIVGYSYCGGCPGGNIEYVPEEMKKNGADVIHFATGMIVDYPPCPYINQFKEFIENQYNLPIVLGTHPIPLKYYDSHNNLSFWSSVKMKETTAHLMNEDRRIMEAYN